MKHCLAIVLFSLGLILSRTPLSFSDYSGADGSEGYGVAFGTESCRHTWDGDDDCVQDLYQAALNNPFCIADTPYCQCEYLGLDCDSGTDPGDGGGLTQEQIDAIAAVLAALQNAQSYANSASGYLSSLNTLYASLTTLESTLADYYGQVSGAVSTINSSLALVAGYLQQGQALGPQALAMVEQQVAIAVLQRGLADTDNRNGQGYTAGDPVLIASGFETYKVEDLNYKAINDLITISRQFRSNQTNLNSSFGRSWFFNYDTNIVAGRKPLIKEREILTGDLQAQAEELAALAAAAVNQALDALQTATTASAAARAKANEIQAVQNEINTLSGSIATLADNAESAAATAAQQAAIAGTSDAQSNASAAQSAADSAGTAANQAAASSTSAAAIAANGSATATSAENDLQLAEGKVTTAQQHKDAILVIVAERTAEAVEAAAEARLEEETYLLDPYPQDPTVYFGPGFIKLFTEEGTPILFEEQEENHYIPVTDNGSYTDEISAMEGGFRLVDKHGGSREFLHNDRGIYLLSRSVDTNNNIIAFTRNGDKLTEIIDVVGRRTILAYNTDGFISLITDPLGNEHRYSYDGDKLTGYTDPMGYLWGYAYDDQARMVARTDPQNNSYQYFYDELNRVTREVDKEGFEFSYSYDPENGITRVTDRRGLVTTHFYNGNHRLEHSVYPDGSRISYAYDGRNNVIVVQDENDNISNLDYNENKKGSDLLY